MLHVHDKTGPGPDWVASAFDNAAFAASKMQAAPLLVLAGEPLRVVWANVAASDGFGAKDNGELTRRLFGSRPELRQRLENLRRRLGPGSPCLERLRIVRGFSTETVTALICRTETPVGIGLAMALVGLGATGSAGPAAPTLWRRTYAEPMSAEPVAGPDEAASGNAEPPEQVGPGETAGAVEDVRMRLRAAFGRRDQRRFLWRSDTDDKLDQIDDQVFDDIGATDRPRSAHLVADEVSRFDPAGAARLRAALATRASFSGVEIRWPIVEERFSIPMTLGALPQFDGGRFAGFRGFGVVDLARLTAEEMRTDEMAIAMSVPAQSSWHPDGAEPHADHVDCTPADPPPGLLGSPTDRGPPDPVPPENSSSLDEPVVSAELSGPSDGAGPSDPVPDRRSDDRTGSTAVLPFIMTPANVVRLWPTQGGGPGRSYAASGVSDAADSATLHPARDDFTHPSAVEPSGDSERDPTNGHNGSLTSSEHSAFREIALVLGAGHPDGHDHPASASLSGAVSEAQAASSHESEPSPPGSIASGDAKDRQTAAIVDTLPLGLVVARGAELLFANRALLGKLHRATISELPPDVGQILAGLDPESAEAQVGFALPAADGTSVAFVGERRTIDWAGGAAALWTLRPSNVAESDVSVPNAAAEAEVGRDAKQLRALVDAAGDAIATIDDSGRILTLNRQGERWFGQDRRRLAGESFTLLLAPESRAVAAALLAEVKTSRDPKAEVARETLARAPDGSSLPLQMALARIGTGVFSAAWRDLSAQKRLEQDVARAKGEADRASSQQPEFLAKISHEIRTPLNAILGFAEVMMDERFGPLGNARYKDYLRDIHTSGTQVMSLVNDLLDLSRIEAGRLDLELAAVDINRVIHDCVAEMQSQAHRERIIMRMSLGARLPAVTADARSAHQIVANLLSNAIKYNEPGGQVIVSTALNDAGAVVIRIKDTGVGMSDADIAAALEPFRQLSASKQTSGTGLGLPLTKALVGANGASLSIRSRPREGTMVEVTFLPTPAAATRMPA